MNMKLLRLTASLVGALAPLSAYAADDVNLMLDWTPGGISAAWYLGIENGCFAEQDINLTVERGYGGADTVTKIAAGVADFGTADLSSIMLGKLSAGAEVTAIMPIYSASPISIAVLDKTGITALTDLEGKTVAAAPGDSGIKILPVAFAEAGGDFSKVNTQSVDFSTLTGLLIQEQVDAITTYSTSAIIIDAAAQKVGKSLKVIPFVADLGVYSNSVFVNDKMIEENPELIERFKTAAVCSHEAAKADLPMAIKAMNTAIGGMDEELHGMIATAALSLVFENDNFETAGFGWNEAGVKKTMDVALGSQGLAESDVEPMSFVWAP